MSLFKVRVGNVRTVLLQNLQLFILNYGCYDYAYYSVWRIWYSYDLGSSLSTISFKESAMRRKNNSMHFGCCPAYWSSVYCSKAWFPNIRQE